MKATIIDTYAGSVLGQIMTDKILTSDEALRLAGYTHGYWEQWQVEGWSDSDGDVVYFSDEIEVRYEKGEG